MYNYGRPWTGAATPPADYIGAGDGQVFADAATWKNYHAQNPSVTYAQWIAAGKPWAIVQPSPMMTAEAIAKQMEASPAWQFYRIAAPISVALCAYHGYRRNQSIGWAIGWMFAGAALPVIAPVIALAQGFGQRKPGR